MTFYKEPTKEEHMWNYLVYAIDQIKHYASTGDMEKSERYQGFVNPILNDAEALRDGRKSPHEVHRYYYPVIRWLSKNCIGHVMTFEAVEKVMKACEWPYDQKPRV